MLRKRKIKQKIRRLRIHSRGRRFHHIYRIKRRIHARYRVGFMIWQK